MSRLDNVIAQVKEVRNNKNRPWIFDENGKISDSAICGDVLELLDELKDYEINVSDKWIEKFLDNTIDNTKVNVDNTYNYNACISNDIDFSYFKTFDGSVIYVMMIHLIGDIRGNYSDYFVVKFNYPDDFYQLNSLRQTIDINDRYVADIYLLSECYSVYDMINNCDVGEYYQIDKNELLDELNKAS